MAATSGLGPDALESAAGRGRRGQPRSAEGCGRRAGPVPEKSRGTPARRALGGPRPPSVGPGDAAGQLSRSVTLLQEEGDSPLVLGRVTVGCVCFSVAGSMAMEASSDGEEDAESTDKVTETVMNGGVKETLSLTVDAKTETAVFKR